MHLQRSTTDKKNLRKQVVKEIRRKEMLAERLAYVEAFAKEHELGMFLQFIGAFSLGDECTSYTGKSEEELEKRRDELSNIKQHLLY